jgi:sensor domain CHASE-containing protein
MPSKKTILAIVLLVVVIVGVAIGAIVLWQSITGSFEDVEDAIDDYVDALNSYDATEAWTLMSPTLRSSKSYSEFEEFVQRLESSKWRASVKSISSRSMETENGRAAATFEMIAKITETDPIVGTETYTEKWVFNLVKVNDRWMINEWLYQ